MLKPWAAALFFLSSPLWAQQIGVDFDPAKSTISWTLAGNVHTVHGTFRLKTGHVTLNPVTGVISGDLVADAASGDSGNGARDRRMDKEILQTGEFKEIHLMPTKVEGVLNLTGQSSVLVSAAFQIHGVTHDITMPLQVSFSGGTVTGIGKFSVPYVDWGMRDPSNFIFKVDKSVEVEVVGVGTVTRK